MLAAFQADIQEGRVDAFLVDQLLGLIGGRRRAQDVITRSGHGIGERGSKQVLIFED